MLWTKAFRYKFAASVAQYLHKLFSYEGAPDVVQSDNGGEFIAGCVRALQQVHRIKKFINSSPHHPQTNGQVERVNQTIINRLKAASNDDPNWSKYLVDATHNYNRDVHSTTGFCPLELHRPHLVDEIDAAVDMFTRVRYTLEVEEQVQKNSNKKANKSIERWEKTHKIRVYQP
jgi:transposase InsO family protein